MEIAFTWDCCWTRINVSEKHGSTATAAQISQAAASILVHHVEGPTIPELNAFQSSQMLQLLGVRLTPSRQKCGLLAFNVLQTMLRTLAGRIPADE